MFQQPQELDRLRPFVIPILNTIQFNFYFKQQDKKNYTTLDKVKNTIFVFTPLLTGNKKKKAYFQIYFRSYSYVNCNAIKCIISFLVLTNCKNEYISYLIEYSPDCHYNPIHNVCFIRTFTKAALLAYSKEIVIVIR